MMTILAISIDLFSLYILFSHFRPRDATRGNSFFQMSSYACANLRITSEKTKGKFPWGHHVVWNGKTKCTSWKGLLQKFFRCWSFIHFPSLKRKRLFSKRACSLSVTCPSHGGIYAGRRGEFAKLKAHHFLGMSPVRTESHVHAFWHLAWIQSTAVVYGTYNGQRTSEDRVGSYLEEQKCSVC